MPQAIPLQPTRFVAPALPRETLRYATEPDREGHRSPEARARRYDVADAIVPGFGVRVTDKGKKSYVLTARFPGSANPTRRTIAEVGAMDLSIAREVARAWLLQIAVGLDPQAEHERAQREAATA